MESFAVEGEMNISAGNLASATKRRRGYQHVRKLLLPLPTLLGVANFEWTVRDSRGLSWIEQTLAVGTDVTTLDVSVAATRCCARVRPYPHIQSYTSECYVYPQAVSLSSTFAHRPRVTAA